MHTQATNLYRKTSQATTSPRELESGLLLKAAHRMQQVVDSSDISHPDLEESIKYNQKLWTILATSATDTSNQMPDALKQNIANIALFIFNQSISILSDPSIDKIKSLITLNRNIAGGLRENHTIERDNVAKQEQSSFSENVVINRTA